MNISTAKGNADYEWAVGLTRSFLNPIGLWPADYRGRKKLFTTLRAALSFALSLFVWTIPSFCSLIMSSDDLILLIDNSSYSFSILISHLKYIVIYKNKKVLLSVLNMIAKDWAKPKTDAERAVMIRRARIGRVIGVFCILSIIILTILMLILPRFGITFRYVRNGTDIQRTFPIDVYYVVGAYRSPYFEMLFTIHVVVLYSVVTSYTGVDNFLGILTFHVCGQLENLRARLASLKGSEEFNRVLASSVEDHVELIRAVDAIENTFSLLLLAVLLYFCVFVCLYGLLVLSMFEAGNNIFTLRMMFLLISGTNTFLQTLFYCIAGQILVTQSEGLYRDIYKCDWINLKPKEAKSLIVLMARAKTPLYITAGKLFPMTMLTFCNILKISLSYISFLITKL